jgi:hypothetical protein
MPNKSFLEELQALEEPTKTKVLIVTTIILMIVVIYFWLVYFNGIVSGSAQSPSISDQAQQQAAPVSPGPQGATSPNQDFWSRVGNGTAIVGQSLGGAVRWLGQVFEKPREYIIKP